MNVCKVYGHAPDDYEILALVDKKLTHIDIEDYKPSTCVITVSLKCSRCGKDLPVGNYRRLLRDR